MVMLNAGDLFKETSNTLKVYLGSAWQDAADSSAFLSDVVSDTTPQLGGNLDVNGNDIFQHQMQILILFQMEQEILI